MEEVKEQSEKLVDEKPDRPEGLTDEMLTWLDDLRVSGQINMLGAAAWLVEEFLISRPEARVFLVYWMETCGNEER